MQNLDDIRDVISLQKLDTLGSMNVEYRQIVLNRIQDILPNIIKIIDLLSIIGIYKKLAQEIDIMDGIIDRQNQLVLRHRIKQQLWLQFRHIVAN